MMRKFENWLFYFFLFAIPISVRHIFWYQPFNFIEWTSIYAYGTDILLFILFLFWAVRRWRPTLLNPVVEGDPRSGGTDGTGSRVWVKKRWSRADVILLVFVVVAGISIKNAIDVHTAIFTWIKLIEGVVLYFYIKDYALKRFSLTKGFEVLVWGGAFQAVIAIAQFMTQGSLGLKYLGESPLAPALSGIAAFYVNGIKVMRAYGTTPHSNVLALYLFIALGAFYSIAIYQKRAWWWHVLHVVILWGFFLTFSRTVIGLWTISFMLMSALVAHALKPSSGRRLMVAWDHEETDGTGFKGLGGRVWATNARKIFWTTIVASVLFVTVYFPYVVNRSVISSTDEAVQLRVLYNHESLASAHNFFGLGMGNFVPWLLTQNLHLSREIYQPVHNIYLLIYSEVGILGVALFILFLAFLLYDFYNRLGFKKLYHFSFGLIIISVLIVGLFDHFVWTIQAGRLLFWLVLGLLAGAE